MRIASSEHNSVWPFDSHRMVVVAGLTFANRVKRNSNGSDTWDVYEDTKHKEKAPFIKSSYQLAALDLGH